MFSLKKYLLGLTLAAIGLMNVSASFATTTLANNEKLSTTKLTRLGSSGNTYDATYNPNFQTKVSQSVAKVDPFSGKVHYKIPLLNKPISSTLSLNLNIVNTFDNRVEDYRETPLGKIGHIALGITNVKRGSVTTPQFIDQDGNAHLFYLAKDGSYYSTDGWKGKLTKSGTYYSGNIYSPNGNIYTIAHGSRNFSPLIKTSDTTGKNFINYTYSSGFYLSKIVTSDNYSVIFSYSSSDYFAYNATFTILRSISTSDGIHFTFTFPPLSGWKNTLDDGTLYITLPNGKKWGLYSQWVFNDPNNPKFAITGVIKEIAYPAGEKQTFSSVYTSSRGVITTAQTNTKLFPYGTISYHYSTGSGTLITTETLGNKQIQYTFQNPSNYPWNKGLLNQQKIIDLSTKKTVKTITNTWSSRKFSTTVDGSQPLLTKKVISQDGANYTTENTKFDSYGYPLQTIEIGNDERITNRTYHEDLSHWIFKLATEKVTNKSGQLANSISNTYNTLGQLLTSSTNGVTTTYTYDTYGNLATKTDALGHVTTYKNYVAGHPTEVIGTKITATGKPAFDDKYSVNLNGTIANTIDSWGNQTIYTYDAMDRLTSITHYKGLASKGIKAESPTTIQWNVPALGDQTVTQGTKKVVTSYLINKSGQLQQQVITLDSATKKSKTITDTYDNYGNVVERNSPTANGSLYETNTYDAFGRKLRKNLYSSQASHQNITGSISSTTHNTTIFKAPVTASGQLTDLKLDINIAFNSPYDGIPTLGDIAAIINGKTYTAKNLDHCTRTQHPMVQYWCFAFEVNIHSQTLPTSKVINITVPRLHTGDDTKYTGNYTIHLPFKKITSTYTYLANTIKKTSPLGKTTTYEYQNFATPSNLNTYKVIDGLGHITTTQRDVMGRVLSITQNALTHTYTYDPNNHFYLTAEKTPGIGTITYGRNILGAMTSKTIAGKTTNYGYDEAGNLTSATYPDNVTNHDNISQTYQYGKLITSHNNNGTWGYSYNALGDMATATYKNATASYPFTYGYNTYGTLSTITYPDGHVYDYKPNALGEATQAGSQIAGVTYFNDGVLSGYNTQSGNHVASSEDDLGRLNSLTIQHSGANLYHQTYVYDLDNNLSSIADSVHATNNQSFGYDKANQLISAKGVWGNAAFSYDANGNIKTLSIGNRSLTYQYNTTKNLLMSITGTQPQTFSYDYLGNMSGVNGNSLTFNAANQLIQVKNPTKTINYSYDANGNRVAINDETNNTLQLYINNNLMYEVTGVNKTDYVYLDGKLVNKVKNNVSEYLFSNLWGSPVAASSNASGGALLWTQQYAPYGKEINDLSTKREKDHIGYTGKVFDDDIGLNYMNARYYDPVIGRFISYDPASIDPNSPLTFNRYAYAANNPYAYIDPTGMSFLGDLWGGIVRNFENIGIGFSYGASGGMVGVGMQGRGSFDYAWYYGGVAVGSAVGMIGGTAEDGMAVRGATYIGENTGMISNDIASTFMGNRYKTYILNEDTELYRAGVNGKPFGQFFSKDAPISEIQTRIDKAILPKWPNGAESPINTAYKFNIPKGTYIHVGEVGYQGNAFIGASEQVYIHEPWNINGVKVLDSYPLG